MLFDRESQCQSTCKTTIIQPQHLLFIDKNTTVTKSLLDEGFTVHATVRDPGKILTLSTLIHFSQDGMPSVDLSSPEKATWLLSFLSNQAGQLRFFKVNLHEDGSLDEAVKDCHGVFHVAASMEFNVSEKQNIESYVQLNIIDPAVRGTLSLLKSCLRSKSVKRVVFTSSISTLTAKENDDNWKSVVDESCQTPIDHVWRAKASGWVYDVLYKLLAEEAAFKFAKENGIDLVSVITPTVAGPFLTSRVPSSIRVVLSPITGDQSFYSILSAVSSRMGAIALIHVEDICNAHIFLMQNPAAEGRYISCDSTCPLHELRNRLALEHLHMNAERDEEEEKEGHGSIPSEISSMKLRDLGFRYKHGLDDIIHQTVASCIDHGFLSSSSS